MFSVMFRVRVRDEVRAHLVAFAAEATGVVGARGVRVTVVRLVV